MVVSKIADSTNSLEAIEMCSSQAAFTVSTASLAPPRSPHSKTGQGRSFEGRDLHSPSFGWIKSRICGIHVSAL